MAERELVAIVWHRNAPPVIQHHLRQPDPSSESPETGCKKKRWPRMRTSAEKARRQASLSDIWWQVGDSKRSHLYGTRSTQEGLAGHGGTAQTNRKSDPMSMLRVPASPSPQ